MLSHSIYHWHIHVQLNSRKVEPSFIYIQMYASLHTQHRVTRTHADRHPICYACFLLYVKKCTWTGKHCSDTARKQSTHLHYLITIADPLARSAESYLGVLAFVADDNAQRICTASTSTYSPLSQSMDVNTCLRYIFLYIHTQP